MTEPLVTIVLPTHNARDSLGLALSGLLRQTEADWECLVIDDGSSDGTPDIIESLGDPRIRVFRQRNRGPAAARNRGLDMATGDFVAFLDDDDFWFPNYLAEMVAVARDGCIATADSLILPAVAPTGGRFAAYFTHFPSDPLFQKREILYWNFVSIMAVFPRELTSAGLRFNEDLDRAEDWDFWIRAIELGWHVRLVSPALAFLNRSATSQTSATLLVEESERRVLQLAADRGQLVSETGVLNRLAELGPRSREARRLRQALDQRIPAEVILASGNLLSMIPKSRPQRERARLIAANRFPRLAILAEKCKRAIP